MNRADAHMHLFARGYVDVLPQSCRRVAPDEVTLYGAYAERYGISRALAVGYEGQPWAAGNNSFLASLIARYPWVRPAAFAPPAALRVAALEAWRREGFVGVSIYLFDSDQVAALGEVPGSVWSWLAQHRWLVSVNSRGEAWRAWAPILERQPELRLLVAHLGLPPRRATQEGAGAAEALAPVLALADYPYTCVKLSGFYALSDPGHEYPHRQAWPYVAALANAFGPRRLLWGSDYSPSLEWVSFPQTFGLLEHIPALHAEALPLVAGENLCALLDTIE